MDVGRLCGVLGAGDHAKHQRISEYVKAICEQYRGMGFTAREEWLTEQVIGALHQMLGDINCTAEEHRALEEFLGLAREEISGTP